MKNMSLPPMNCPFEILVDTQEEIPWTFEGMYGDASEKYRLLDVKTERRYIDRLHGDYQIKGFPNLVSIERKSVADHNATLLGWAPGDKSSRSVRRTGRGRRDRFHDQLTNMQSMYGSAVIVEGTALQCINSAPEYGQRTCQQNMKTLSRTMLSLTQKYRVPFYYFDNRALAEAMAFRLMWKWYHEFRTEKFAIWKEQNERIRV